jgi:tetratricopeptide (TPR) repeat protein
MKKTILSLMMISYFFVAFAQKSEINSAKQNYSLYEVGLQTKSPMKKQLELLKLAKESTDKAIINDKTKDNSELWAYRSIIYSAIAITDTLNKANSEAAFKAAQEAVASAKVFDTKKENTKFIESAEQNLAIMMQNRGVAAFNKKDYKQAYDSFKFIADVKPQDSLFNMYTAIAANSAQMYDEAAKYFRKTIEVNPKNPALYDELAKVYLAKTDTTNALKVIEEGRIKHPEFMTLIYDELNIYLNRGQAAQQVSKIENAIAKDPKNKTLYFVAGVAYSANKQLDKAEESYNKALAIDPSYSDAIYNLAVIYINRANDYITQANKLPNNKTSDVKYNELKKKFEGELSKAVPLLEKARELSPKDVNTLNTLREVYIKLNKLDKAAEVKKTLDQM